MRKNELYKCDIEINGVFFHPGFLGSLDNLADWAYEIHVNHPYKKLQITAEKVIFTDNGTTGVAIPPLDKSETQEVLELERQGELAHVWLFTTLGLIQSSSPNTQ